MQSPINFKASKTVLFSHENIFNNPDNSPNFIASIKRIGLDKLYKPRIH
jgi:hypothetical protein